MLDVLLAVWTGQRWCERQEDKPIYAEPLGELGGQLRYRRSMRPIEPSPLPGPTEVEYLTLLP